MLHIRELDVYYGRVQALHGVSLHVARGQIVTLVGANGAGKSTLLRAISGLVARRGTIRFDGRDLSALRPEQVVRAGIAHVPEGRRIFPGLTVRENLAVAGESLGHPRHQVDADIDTVLGLFPSLARRVRSYGWSLSGGEQQMLAIGRGLMARPRMLLLDEPSLGLAPAMVEQVFTIVAKLRERGVAVLLVEQNATMALSVADYGYVLEVGRLTRSGPAAQLLRDERIVAAYLGEEG